MLILASDTTTATASVALWQDGRLLAESFVNRGLTHSVTFMPLVEALLAENNLTAADVTHYAVTTGPGSFTGIRIGVSAVKAMAYASAKPVLGFSTLLVLAWPYQLWPDTLLCPALDARNDRVYAAGLLASQELVQADNWSLVDYLQQLAGQVAHNPQISRLLFIGLAPDRQQLAAAGIKKQIAVAPAAAWHPRAGWLAEMAALEAGRGAGLDPLDLQAEYLALSSAQRLRQKDGND